MRARRTRANALALSKVSSCIHESVKYTVGACVLVHLSVLADVHKIDSWPDIAAHIIIIEPFYDKWVAVCARRDVLLGKHAPRALTLNSSAEEHLFS